MLVRLSKFLCHSTGVRFFPPGWEARLYGKQGCSPLLRAERESLFIAAGIGILPA